MYLKAWPEAHTVGSHKTVTQPWASWLYFSTWGENPRHLPWNFVGNLSAFISACFPADKLPHASRPPFSCLCTGLSEELGENLRKENLNHRTLTSDCGEAQYSPKDSLVWFLTQKWQNALQTKEINFRHQTATFVSPQTAALRHWAAE